MTDHAFGQDLFQAQHAIAVGLEQAIDRHVGELGHHLGHAFCRDLRLAATARARARQIQNRDRLVRQRATGQVAHRPTHAQRQSFGLIAHLMMRFQTRLERIHDQVSVLATRLLDLDQREATREPSVRGQGFLEVFGRGGADARQLAAREGELELGSDLFRRLTDEQLMDLVEKDHDAPFGGEHFLAQRSHARGERAAHAGTRHQFTDRDLNDHAIVEREHVFRGGDALREAAHDARLAHAGDAHEARIVALALGEHVQRLLDDRVAAHHRIELAARGRQREISAQRRQSRELLRIELETLPRFRLFVQRFLE